MVFLVLIVVWVLTWLYWLKSLIILRLYEVLICIEFWFLKLVDWIVGVKLLMFCLICCVVIVVVNGLLKYSMLVFMLWLCVFVVFLFSEFCRLKLKLFEFGLE